MEFLSRIDVADRNVAVLCEVYASTFADPTKTFAWALHHSAMWRHADVSRLAVSDALDADVFAIVDVLAADIAADTSLASSDTTTVGDLVTVAEALLARESSLTSA